MGKDVKGKMIRKGKNTVKMGDKMLIIDVL